MIEPFSQEPSGLRIARSWVRLLVSVCAVEVSVEFLIREMVGPLVLESQASVGRGTGFGIHFLVFCLYCFAFCVT